MLQRVKKRRLTTTDMMKNVLLFGYIALTVQVSAALYERSGPQLDLSATADSASAMVEGTTLNVTAPDFASIADIKAKKRAFFDFMLPLIREANRNIRSDRTELEAIGNRFASGAVLNGEDHQRLEQLFTRYGLTMPQTVETRDLRGLLDRVDVVPASLVLAQAANESGWGTSRFAVEANNYFGIWCFSKGCGVVPSGRDGGARHEVARYRTAMDGVVAYMHNINTHNAYRDLREMRAEQRHVQERLHGHQLAEGLNRYSERGLAYVREIQTMIRVNRLEQYTLPIKA